MTSIGRLILFISLLSMAGTLTHADTGKPSMGAENLPGAMGTFEFSPEDHIPQESSWWKDSDGVNPGVAGCHIGTDSEGTPNGRSFGEACLPSGLLVESNPGKNELHKHENDFGHPDKFDCNAWCIGSGKKSGSCEIADAPPCTQSAVCACE